MSFKNSSSRWFCFFALAGVLLSKPCLLLAQSVANDSDDPHIGSRYIWAKDAINGYRAGLGLYNFQVIVEIHRDIQITGIPHRRRGIQMTPPFLMATNGCPGPMELIGPDGGKISIHKPEVLSSNAYPEVLNYDTIQHDMGASTGFIWGQSEVFDILPADKIDSDKDTDQLTMFELGDYFNYGAPGTYQLIMRPKLYQRSATNDVIFHRIDLPPVSMSFTNAPKSK